MERLESCFRVAVGEDKMNAFVDCRKDLLETGEEIHADKETWKAFLASKDVVYGLQYHAISQLADDPLHVNYPVTVALGFPPEKGADGKIEFFISLEEEMQRDDNWNFRDVMRIPSVRKGEKLAKLVSAAKGTDGMNVRGETVAAIPGKPATVRTGKNVVFKESDHCYYAAENGQFSYNGRKMEVLPEFHVNGTLTMEVGNLNFVGSIIIQGDVPTGFTVQAAGDVKIFGMVEAAEVIAGGSIYIAEGIAGQGKGRLQAGGNVQIGYINQAEVFAGKDLYVENSILHSNCVVQEHVYSQRGNIIGGTLSAGKSIEAKDIGTRFNTKTEIVLGVNKSIADEESRLKQEKKNTEDMIRKLELLGERLKLQDTSNAKIRLSALRQKHSLIKAREELEGINEKLDQINAVIGDMGEAKLIVRNFIYQNTSVAFGKYQRIMKADYHFVELKADNQEIILTNLF